MTRRTYASVAILTLLLSGCTLFRSAGETSAPKATPSASAGVARSSPTPGKPTAVWVLSPLGLNLRDQPNTAANIVTTIAQGTKLQVTDFQSGDPGWYQVQYQGKTGWVAARKFTTTRPQNGYSSSAAGYYFTYPADWNYTANGNDVEVDASGTVSPSPGLNPGAAATPSPAAAGTTRILVHEAGSPGALGQVPSSDGALVARDQIEVFGKTTLKSTYTLNNSPYRTEIDLKLALDSSHAVLLTFQARDSRETGVFDDFLNSFGVSLAPASPGA